jgi:MFS transporter, CP family, cyanate transporter
MAALFIAALALRPELIGIGPLLSTIQRSLGISHSVAGLLSTIVVLCMGVFAPLGYRLTHWAGPRRTLAVALLVVGLAGIARAAARPAWLLIGLTVPLGIGTAVAGSLMPVVVSESLPKRPVLGTSLYTTGFSLGGAAAAGIAVPLAAALGGWRAALIAFSAFALLVACVWIAMTRGYGSSRSPTERPLHLPVRSRTAWLLVGIFALTEMTFFAINAWLPATYTARGWTPARAGDLVTVINGVTIPCTILVALLGDRRGSRRAWLLGGASLQLGALLGILLAPAGGWAWAVMLGAANGLLFPSVMMMPLDVAETAPDVGAVTALMLGVGLSIAAAGPLITGVVRDLTGRFTVAIAGIAVLTAIDLLSFVLVSHQGLRRDPSGRIVEQRRD